MKNKRLWPIVIIVGILLLIWIPVFFNLYNSLTALLLMPGILISAYAGEQLLKKKREKGEGEMKRIAPVLILIGLLIVIWTPCLLNLYGLTDASIITVSMLFGGYIGGKFLKTKKQDKWGS